MESESYNDNESYSHFSLGNEIELGEVIDVLSGYAFKGKDFITSGVPVIKIKNIVPPIISFEDVQYVSKELYDEKTKFSLKFNDILISLTGSGLNQMASAVGKVGRVRTKDVPLLLNQRVGKVIVKDKTKIDEDFLYYWISRKEVQYLLTMSAGGSANQANISPSDIKKLKIQLPSLREQREIKKILLSLDNKIELNKQIISNLEQLAQNIFKHWFVDFEFPNEVTEPYKSSGGEMIESSIGSIPSKWNVKSLIDIANYQNGLAMQKFRPEDNSNSLPVLKIKELNQGFIEKNGERCKTDIKESVKVYNGDVIFSWSGTLLVKLWVGGDAGLNQHLFKVTSDSFPKWFYYYWTKHHLNQFIAIAADKATTMGHIKRSHLSESKVLIPTQKELEIFTSVINPFLEEVIEKGTENKRLQDLRDSLLPKLLSGEIELPDENEVTEHVPVP